jgi:hypothetical protein
VTRHLISETSSTSKESQQNRDAATAASTRHERGASDSRSGLFLAGLVLFAALTTAGVSGTAPTGIYSNRRRDEIATESSTAEVERDPALLQQVESVFAQGASEFFEDGMSSNFSRSLMAFVAQYRRAAFQAITEYVFSGDGNTDVISEALRWLADFDDPATLTQRWALLQRTLQDRSPRVRDGAILGFAALDDPRARSLLSQTQNSESIPELRRLIRQVINQLNETHATLPPQR